MFYILTLLYKKNHHLQVHSKLVGNLKFKTFVAFRNNRYAYFPHLSKLCCN